MHHRKQIRHRSLFSFSLTLLVFSGFLSPVLADEPVDQVLDRVREAVGFENMQTWKQGMVVEGQGVALGLESRFSNYFLSRGRFRSEIQSELSYIIGFDGTRGWNVDFSGMPGHLETASLEVAQIQNWVQGGYWLDSACPLEISLVPSAGKDDPILLQLGMPEGHIKARVEIDEASALPARLTWKTLKELNRMQFERYKKVGAEGRSFLMPHKVHTMSEGMEVLIRVDSVNEAGAEAAAACYPVTERPDDTRFDSTVPPRVEMVRLSTGHLAVRPLVDGEDVGVFLFDTGAGMNVIDKSTADRLGMKAMGAFKAVGIGGTIDVSLRVGGSLALGPATIQQPLFMEMDLQGIGEAIGVRLGGLVGTDFINRCLIDLDLANAELAVYPPGAWQERSEDWEEIVFYNNVVCVAGMIEENHQGHFILDSGAGAATVGFNESFVGKKALFGDSDVGLGSTGGAGGRISTYTGTIPWFEFCGRRLENLPVDLMTSDSGLSKVEGAAGLIGTRVLSRYRLLLDYPNKRLALLDKAE